MLRFGSLDFVATGNGYDMELLPDGANPDTLTPPPQCRRRSGQRARQARMERRRVARLATPTSVEVGVSQPSAGAEDVAALPPPSAATVRPKEGVAMPPPFPFGMRSTVAAYA